MRAPNLRSILSMETIISVCNFDWKHGYDVARLIFRDFDLKQGERLIIKIYKKCTIEHDFNRAHQLRSHEKCDCAGFFGVLPDLGNQ